MRRKLRGSIIVLMFILVLFWSFVKVGLIQLMEIGYLTGAQGLQAEFHTLYFNETWCSQSFKPSWARHAANWQFGFELNFDPDETDDGWPNLCATQQPFTVDTHVEPKHYAWQVDKGVVTLDNGTRARKVIQFEMWRYRCEWAVNIWLSGPEAESSDRAWHGGISWEPNYGGSQIWIRLIPQRFVYFKDNPDEVYFAPAYIGLESYQIASIDKDNKETTNDPDVMSCIDLIPKAVGETLGIYYERGGTPTDIEHTLLSYEGAELDPKIFRNEYWIHIDLLQFKPYLNVDFWTKALTYKWPSINLRFVVYVFVVGKWTVYFAEDEVPKLNPHTPPSLVRDPWAWLRGIGEWFANPINQLWLVFIIIVIVILVITILNPGIWAMLIGWLRGRKGNGG